jgi:hypothetical protein
VGTEDSVSRSESDQSTVSNFLPQSSPAPREKKGFGDTESSLTLPNEPDFLEADPQGIGVSKRIRDKQTRGALAARSPVLLLDLSECATVEATDWLLQIPHAHE